MGNTINELASPSNLIALAVQLTAREFGIEVNDLTAIPKGRMRIDARTMAMHVAYDNGEYIMPIASYFGMTKQGVGSAIRRSKSRVRTSKPWGRRYDRIMAEFQNRC